MPSATANRAARRGPLLRVLVISARALPAIVCAAAAAGALLWAAPPPAAPDPSAVDPGRLLAAIRPDYRRYIGRVRPLGSDPTPKLYMALVRPGATDPARRDSAPFTGSGARNDILYGPASVDQRHSDAWRLLLLDHEYFHARHLAGTTSLPLPAGLSPDIEKHFYETAAWGFNIGEARAGRYPGLRPEEFREALDRYGEHYAALRAMLQGNDARLWDACSLLLRGPAALFRTGRPPLSAGPSRPSDRDRSQAIP